MKLLDRIKEQKNEVLDKNVAQKIMVAWDIKVLPIKLEKILPLFAEATFWDDYEILRGLSQDEILKADVDLNVKFTEKGILPMLDMGANDFICYDLKEDNWCKFNLVDEIKFDITSELQNFL